MILGTAIQRGSHPAPAPAPSPVRPAWTRRFWNQPSAAPPLPPPTPVHRGFWRQPPAHVYNFQPALAPPPPPPPALAPPPPPPPPPTWQQQWSAFRTQIAERQANQGAGHFNGFGRPVQRGHVRPAPRVHRGSGWMRPYLQPTILPVETIYMQPLPGCTISPHPIPPCSGTLTWVDSRTVCCR